MKNVRRVAVAVMMMAVVGVTGGKVSAQPQSPPSHPSHTVHAASYPTCWTGTIKAQDGTWIADYNTYMADNNNSQGTWTICQQSAAYFTVKANAPGSNYCGVTNTTDFYGTYLVTCTAGGPGPHELFQPHCFSGLPGYSWWDFYYPSGTGYNNEIEPAFPYYPNGPDVVGVTLGTGQMLVYITGICN